MVAPILVSSIPVTGADNVPTNLELSLTFSTPIDADSIDGAIQVYDIDQDIAYPIELGVEDNVVTIYLGRALEDYTRFEIRIYGQDLVAVAPPIKSVDGDPLLLSTYVTFMTAVPVVTGIAETDDDYIDTEIDASGNITVNVFDKFEFSSSNPTDGTLFINPAYFNPAASGQLGNPVVFTFNQPVDPVSTSGNFEIEQRPFVDRRFAVVKATEVDELNTVFVSPSGNSYCPSNIDTFNYPDFTAVVDNNTVSLHIDETDGLRWNSQVRVTVKADLLSTEATGAQDLGKATNVLFTTGMYPWFAEIESIRLELGSYNTLFTDFLISRYILRSSIRAWRLTCFMFDLCNPPYSVIDYVVLRTLYDLFTGPEGIGKLGSEKSKSLGDFSVSYSSGGGSIDAKALIVEWQNQLREAESWLKGRCKGVGGYQEIGSAVRGSKRDDYPPSRYRERHWHSASYGDRYYPGIENSWMDRIQKNPRVDGTYESIEGEYSTETNTTS